MNLIILCRIIFILKFPGNQLHALKSKAETSHWVVDQVEELIKVREKPIETQHLATIALIEQHVGLLNAFVFVTSIMDVLKAVEQQQVTQIRVVYIVCVVVTCKHG